MRIGSISSVPHRGAVLLGRARVRSARAPARRRCAGRVGGARGGGGGGAAGGGGAGGRGGRGGGGGGGGRGGGGGAGGGPAARRRRGRGTSAPVSSACW